MKGEADDARQPLVEVVLVLRLLGLVHAPRGIAGHELGAAALGKVAGELGVPIILELLDLLQASTNWEPRSARPGSNLRWTLPGKRLCPLRYDRFLSSRARASS